MNIPYWVYITEITMDEFICLNLFIKLHDPDDHSLIDQMTKELTDSTPEYVKASSVYKDK